LFSLQSIVLEGSIKVASGYLYPRSSINNSIVVENWCSGPVVQKGLEVSESRTCESFEARTTAHTVPSSSRTTAL